VYLGLAWGLLVPQAVWSPDEGAKFLQLVSLRLENGQLITTIPYLGRALDPNLKYALTSPQKDILSILNGELTLLRLPVFPLLTLPFFRFLGLWGLYLLPALAGALTGLVSIKLLAPYERRLSMWLLIAFGSPIFIYATIFWEHTLAVALGLTGAWMAIRSCREGDTPIKTRPPSLFNWLLSGILLSVAVYLRLEMIIFAAALLFACLLLMQGRKWGPILAGGICVLTLLAYQPLFRTVFPGKTMPRNTEYVIKYPLAYLTQAQWRVIPDLLVGPGKDEAIEPGWLGGLWAVAAVIAITHAFSQSSTARHLCWFGLGISILVAFYFLINSATYRSAHGLLFTTPWALAGITRMPEVWKTHSQRARIIVLSTAIGLMGYTVAIVGFRASSPQGGLEWGARFAMVFYPLLALIALWEWKPGRRLEMGLVWCLILLGLGFQVRGLWTIYHDKTINHSLNQVVLASPDDVVISDLWWLPLNAAPIYPQKAIFVAPSAEAIARFATNALDHQVDQFTLVTLDPDLPADISAASQTLELQVLETSKVENLVIFRVMSGPK
jgi:multisubunit Na+/H+ antiporter MnhB subunit